MVSVASKDALQERIPILMLMFIFCMSTSPGFPHCCLDSASCHSRRRDRYFLAASLYSRTLCKAIPTRRRVLTDGSMGNNNVPFPSSSCCCGEDCVMVIDQKLAWIGSSGAVKPRRSNAIDTTDNASPFDSLTPRTKSGQWRSHHAQHASYYFTTPSLHDLACRYCCRAHGWQLI